MHKFPIEVLPEGIQNIITEVEECLNFPKSFVGTAMLQTAGLAVGNACRIKVNEEWSESASLYTILVGAPGSMKSPALKYVYKPIKEYESLKHEEYVECLKEYIENEEKGNKPISNTLTVSDYTPESLVEKHSANPMGTGVFVDEIAGWIKNFNRYSSGSEKEFWLSAWSGSEIKVDRKSSPSLYIKKPFIPVIGTIQYETIKEVLRKGDMNNGFVHRILFAIPESNQIPHLSSKKLSSNISSGWKMYIDKLLELRNRNALDLTYSENAIKAYENWHREVVEYQNNQWDPVIKEMWQKYKTYIHRLALIHHLLKTGGEVNNVNNVIGSESIQAAATFIHYFFNCGYDIIKSISNPTESLNDIKKNLYAALPKTFHSSDGWKIAEGYDISKSTYNRFLKMDDLFIDLSHGNWQKKV